MAALLFKLFPTLWPFLLEMLVGGKDHPHSFERDENKRPGFVTVLLFIITALVYILATTIEDRDKLVKELQEANKPSSKVQDLSVEIYVCEKAKKDLSDEVIALETNLQLVRNDLITALNKPPVECLATKESPSVQSSLAEKARKRIEDMQKKD